MGAILYALLTGRAPFGGATVLDTLEQVRERPPESPRKVNPQVPRDLEVICLKCLEKDPQRRYASADAVTEDLNRWLAGEPIAARPVGKAARVWMWCRRNPFMAGAASLVASLLVVAMVLSLLYANAQSRRAIDQADANTKITRLNNSLEKKMHELEASLTNSNRLAMLYMERGQAACDRGQIDLGLLWFVESLRAATDAVDSVWKNVALTTLSGWQGLQPRQRGGLR